MNIQWEPAPYSSGKAFIADTPAGRLYVTKSSVRRAWVAKLNGTPVRDGGRLQWSTELLAKKAAERAAGVR